MRTIRHILDNTPTHLGRKLVLVPLDDTLSPLYVTLYEDSFWELIDKGCSDTWWRITKENKPYCWIVGLSYPISVARLVTKAGVGETVSSKDKDNYNLRLDNLVVKKDG